MDRDKSFVVAGTQCSPSGPLIPWQLLLLLLLQLPIKKKKKKKKKKKVLT